LTELLKQKQYVPMIAEEQVCVLYAGVRGFLDKIQTSEIGKFEKIFLEHLKSKYPHIIETIKKEKQLNDKINADMKQILEEFIPTSGLQMRG
jgi:F0F1-type ATP synthase alpha subunit